MKLEMHTITEVRLYSDPYSPGLAWSYSRPLEGGQAEYFSGPCGPDRSGRTDEELADALRVDREAVLRAIKQIDCFVDVTQGPGPDGQMCCVTVKAVEYVTQMMSEMSRYA